MPDDLIGQQLGGYEIVDRIDQGGMATVYRARQTSMNRVVALKILPKHFMRDDTYLRRFEREVEIIAQLEHRNIVPVYDYGEHDGQPFIAMRYMPAGSVDDLIGSGPLMVERTLDIIEQVSPALDYAHNKNILHRDLKPSNILLDENGDAYLTDFGIARILGMEGKGTTITTQGVVGTPSYMSPEQAQGKDMDARSDIYALGVMLFEMLTGRRPFENDTPYGIAVMQVTTPPPSPRVINPALTAAIEQVVLKALKKKPENRYNTAAELSQAFKLAVERPDSVHDTEPRGLSIKPPLDATQPAGAQSSSLSQGQTVPSSPAQPPPAQPQPQQQPQPRQSPPPSAYGPAAYPPASSASMPRIPNNTSRPMTPIRKRRGNMWVSVLLGMVIGCSLLSVLVVATLLTLDDLFENSDDTAETTSDQRPPAEMTGDAARLTLVPGAAFNNLDTTPVVENATAIPSRTPTTEPTEGIAPVGARPTPTVDPDLSAQSERIIYFAVRDNAYDVFQYDLTTGEETRLTDTAATISYPLASPDGAYVAYQAEEDGDFEIYVLRLSDGTVTQLTDNDVLDRLPAWSPDGAWIVYSSDTRDDGNFDLYRVRRDGSDQQVIYSDGGRNSHARFSSDGRFLIFTSGEAGNAQTWEILRFELETGEISALTDNASRDASPSFSPDDTQIVYIVDGDNGAAIAVMDADGSNSQIIYDGAGYEWGAAFSPDGELIVFSEETQAGSVIKLMRADGEAVRDLSIENGFYPSWVR